MNYADLLRDGYPDTAEKLIAAFGVTEEEFAPWMGVKNATDLITAPEPVLRAIVAAKIVERPFMDLEMGEYYLRSPSRFAAYMAIVAALHERRGDIGIWETDGQSDMWEKIGAFLWPFTYRFFPNDDYWACQAALIMWDELFAGRGVSWSETMDTRQTAQAAKYGAGAARWIDGAKRILTTTSAYLSAMACTSIHEEAFEDIRVPWPSFCVHVPPGHLVDDGKDYDRIFVSLLDDVLVLGTNGVVRTSSTVMVVCTSKAPHDSMEASEHGPDSLRAVLFRHLPNIDLNTTESRILQAAKRIVVGLLYTIQYTTHWRERVERGQVSRNLRENPPPHRVVFVGRKLAVNAKPALHDFIAGPKRRGTTRPPSVQVLVRGHTKRQVVGVGRLGRKVIWIEPYWRGPEEAPILSHPYEVG